jgi:hypothetical protein
MSLDLKFPSIAAGLGIFRAWFEASSAKEARWHGATPWWSRVRSDGRFTAENIGYPLYGEDYIVVQASSTMVVVELC